MVTVQISDLRTFVPHAKDSSVACLADDAGVAAAQAGGASDSGLRFADLMAQFGAERGLVTRRVEALDSPDQHGAVKRLWFS